MENVAAVVIVLAGAFLLIVGARGTQGSVFPGLFPHSGTTTTPGTSTTQAQGSGGPPAGANGSYTLSQLQQLALNAGFNQAQSVIAAAIAMAESGGNPNAIGPYGEQGLWQIYPAAHPDLAQQYNLYDPLQNAIAAFQVFNQQGWKAWTTYTSGAYQQYLTGHQH